MDRHSQSGEEGGGGSGKHNLAGGDSFSSLRDNKPVISVVPGLVVSPKTRRRFVRSDSTSPRHRSSPKSRSDKHSSHHSGGERRARQKDSSGPTLEVRSEEDCGSGNCSEKSGEDISSSRRQGRRLSSSEVAATPNAPTSVSGTSTPPTGLLKKYAQRGRSRSPEHHQSLPTSVTQKSRSPRPSANTFLIHTLQKSVVYRDCEADVALSEILDDLGDIDPTTYIITDSNTQRITPTQTLKEVPHEVFLFPANYDPATAPPCNILFLECDSTRLEKNQYSQLLPRYRFFKERNISEWGGIASFFSDRCSSIHTTFHADLKSRKKSIKDLKKAKSVKETGFIGSFSDQYKDKKKAVFGRDSADKSCILAISDEALIEILTHPMGLDRDIASVYFMSYDLTSNATELVNRIKKRFEVDDPQVHKTAIEFLKMWAGQQSQVFLDDPILTSDLISFSSSLALKYPTNTAVQGFNIYAKSLACKKKKKTLIKENLSTAPPTLVYLPIDQLSNDMDVLDIHPSELARQFCLIDSQLFRNIRIKDYCQKDPGKTKNIAAFISRFNLVSLWVQSTVCLTDTPVGRAKVIEYFIYVAMESLLLKNYNSVCAIVSGISSPAVERLLYTWLEVPKITNEHYQDLRKISSDFPTLRAHMSVTKGPCVPYIGQYMKDLIAIDEGNQSRTEAGFVNFAKATLWATQLSDIWRHSSTQYSFHPVDKIQNLLLDLHVLSDDFVYEESLVRESRQQTDELKRKNK